jgi:hypothetical protein
MHRSLWQFFSSITLSIWLLLAISFTLLIGSIYSRYLPTTYNKLDYTRFQDWITSHGFVVSWWIWLLFLLLTLFAINTAACTSERLWELLKKRSEFPFASFMLLISPSVMHLCFLAIIGGHAISQFSSDIRQLPARNGMKTALSSGTLAVIDTRCSFRSEPGLTGILRSCTAHLSLSSEEGTVVRYISLMEPTSIGGYSIHLIMAGKAKQGKTPEMKLVTKKDPGLALILLGNILLCILMLWYFPVVLRSRKQ